MCEEGLYVLHDGPTTLAAIFGVSKKATYELCHSRLGHISFDVISILNNLGVFHVTSLLPKPSICKPCQLSKGQRLSFELNLKRDLCTLDFIHCDLWGPTPVALNGYLYYVVYVDDFSRFTWLYRLKTESGFYPVLTSFINLMQTQFPITIKVFQSYGGTEFFNNTIKIFFEANGTFHRLSCPYGSQQNGCAERKHCHIVEIGLVMLFHAHVHAYYWVDAFTSAIFIDKYS